MEWFTIVAGVILMALIILACTFVHNDSDGPYNGGA